VKDGADVGARVSTGGVDGGTPEAINISGATTIIGTNLNLAQNDRGVRTAGRMELNVTDGATIQGNIHTNIHGDKVDQIINVTNSTVKGDILGSATGVDKVTVTNSTIDNINTKGGDDVINVNSGSKIYYKVSGGDGKDTIVVDGAGTKVGEKLTTPELKLEGSITGGTGDDDITLSGGAHALNAGVAGWQGNDTITIKDKGTKAFSVAGHDGNDIIRVESGATVDHAVSANTGDGSVVVTGKDTNVGGIQSNGNSDILVDDQAVVKGGLFAYATQGEQNIIVQGGSNVNTISTIYNFVTDKITSGHTKDNITIKDAYTTVKNIRTGDHDDTLIVQDGAVITGSAILGSGKDTKITATNNDGNLIINSMEGDKTIDLSNLSYADKNIKSIDLSAVDGAKMNITAKDVLDIDKANGDETLTIKGGNDDTVSDTGGSTWTGKDNGSSKEYSTELSGETVIINIDKNISTDL
ncbi:hypothetical protein, partial [Campylobacter sp. RM15925]|uniref:hypothetical protein n=1 Tax=Campylobacter sp. RM15925 TaxID=1705724 RepID=UPI0014756A09